MASVVPVFMDGPLVDETITVDESQVEQGMFPYTHTPGGEQVIYTFTIVQLFGRGVVVASQTGGIPTLDQMWDFLATAAAKAAVPR
jgi:hypothetical protein